MPTPLSCLLPPEYMTVYSSDVMSPAPGPPHFTHSQYMYPHSCHFLLNVVKFSILEQSSYVPRCNFQSRLVAHSSWMTIWYHLSHVTVPTGRGISVRISIHAVSGIICICVGHNVLGMIQQCFPIAFCRIVFIGLLQLIVAHTGLRSPPLSTTLRLPVPKLRLCAIFAYSSLILEFASPR